MAICDTIPVMEKKKIKKSEYIANFVKNKDGGYRYTGEIYPAPKKWNTQKVKLTGLYGLTLILMVAAGCIPSQALKNSFYVILPYAACIGLTLYCLYHLYELHGEGTAVKDYIYQRHYEPLQGKALAAFLLCGLTVIGALVFGMTHTDRFAGEIPLILIGCLAFACTGGAYNILKNLQWFQKS